MRDVTRTEQTFWVGEGDQLLVSSLTHLTPRERAEVPDGAAALLEGWPARLAAIPPELAWARDGLRARTPLLERVSIPPSPPRLYWTVRLAGWGDASPLAHPCLGATGVPRGRTDLPEPLGWLASTFGTANIVAEQSGTAPFGRPLADFLANQELLVDTAPAGSEGWVALYECDGDAIFADLDTGAAWWLGHEWTGNEATRVPVSWKAVAAFVLWRMLDGGWVRPKDLDMLASGGGSA